MADVIRTQPTDTSATALHSALAADPTLRPIFEGVRIDNSREIMMRFSTAPTVAQIATIDNILATADLSAKRNLVRDSAINKIATIAGLTVAERNELGL